MICPECENGKTFHPLAHVRASKDFGKYIPCSRCNGSGIAYCCDGEDIEAIPDKQLVRNTSSVNS